MGKGKRAKVDEEEGSELDPELVMAIEKLQEVQDNLERVNEEASDKVLEVEQKYNEIRRPEYNKRNDVIQNIPDFWLTALGVKDIPEQVELAILEDMDFLQKFHHALLEVHLEEGALICPKTGRRFRVMKGVPNMLLHENEV